MVPEAAPPGKDKVNTILMRAPIGLDPATETAILAGRVAPPRQPEPSGLSPEEIRRIILELLG